MSRAATIHRAILEILNRCGDYALPEEQLATELDGTIRPPATRPEFVAALTALNNAGRIKFIGDDLDAELRKFLITEQGKTVLARQP